MGYVIIDKNDIALGNKVDHKVSLTYHDKRIRRLRRNNRSVLRPMGEFVACRGHRRERAYGARFVGAGTAHRAALHWVGGGVDAKGTILYRAHQAYGLTPEAEVVAARTEVTVAEVHGVRAVATVGRGRPVVDEGTDIVDRSAPPVARGGEEDRSVLLQGCPLGGGDDIGGETSSRCVRAVQGVVVGAPVVGQQDHTVDIVHLGLCVTDAGCRGAGVEQIHPLVLGQRPPCVGCVASVADGVVTPIGLTRLVEQVITGLSVCVIVTFGYAGTPRLVAHRTVVVTAGAPAEKVNPAAVGLRNVRIVEAHTVPLPWCKTPGVGRGSVLQVSWGEIHL